MDEYQQLQLAIMYQFSDYIREMYTHKKMDILEETLNEEDIDMVICLLKENPTYMHHELSDGSTCKDKLVQLNEYEYVLSKI